MGPMDPRATARAIPGRGLEGCASNSRTRQVTLIERELWESLMTDTGADVPPSTRRANLMVSGFPLADSRNRLFQIGSVLLRISGETKPCELMNRAHPGLQAAMYENWRGGAFAQVLESGEIAVGDPVEWTGRVIAKVLAYITRSGPHGLDVLVFRHRDFPEAGLQVPAGTVDEGEALPQALWREIKEETGLGDLHLTGQIAKTLYHSSEKNEWHERNIFHLEAAHLPDSWDHVVVSDAQDNGLHFCFFWMPATVAQRILVARQGEWLDRIQLWKRRIPSAIAEDGGESA
jgi:ADP-ribose pyrophosphatase YjhB (NUDIX family)